MKKLLCITIGLALTLTITMTGCTAKKTDALEAQLKSYKEENERLKQENLELSEFKDRFSFSLTKIEDTLFNLKNEGYLPFAGTQVNAPELINALKDIKNIAVEIKDDELILSMMPQEWSEDYKTVLIVYDVYKPVLNMSAEDAGEITTMAGIFKNTDGKWDMIKFTREYKGDDSFTIKEM